MTRRPMENLSESEREESEYESDGDDGEHSPVRQRMEEPEHEDEDEEEEEEAEEAGANDASEEDVEVWEVYLIFWFCIGCFHAHEEFASSLCISVFLGGW